MKDFLPSYIASTDMAGYTFNNPEPQGGLYTPKQYSEPIGPQEGIYVEGYLAEDKPEWKPSSPDQQYLGDTTWDTIKGRASELGRKMGSLAAYGKDRAKQNVSYGIDAIAGWLAGDKDGRFSTEGINERVPANTQDWLTYDQKREDYKSDKDFPYSAYAHGEAYDPSQEYANFTDTDVYNLLDAENISGGKVGRAIGDFINRLGGNFESTDKEDELAYKKGLAALHGMQGYMADTLPEQIEMLLGEMGLRGAMATLGPAFVRAKKVKGQMDAAEKDLLDAMRTEKDMAKIKDLEGRANAYGDVFYGKLDDFEKQAEWRKLGETFLKENHPEVLEQIKKGYPTDLADSIIKDIGASRANGRPWGISTYRDYGYPTRGHRIADVRLNRHNADKLKQIVEQGSGKDADRVFRYLMDENNVDDIPMDAFKNTIRGRAFMEGENLPMPDEIINEARRRALPYIDTSSDGVSVRAMNEAIADEMKRLGKDYGQAYYEHPTGDINEIINEIVDKAKQEATRALVDTEAWPGI